VADHRLKPLLPLGGDAPRVETFDGFVLSENAGLALASLSCRHGRAAELAKASLALFGIAMPGPGKFVSAPPYGIFWTGPEQWFIEAPFATHEDIARILRVGLRDTASVTEQTDGWVQFDVEGARVADVFERLCALDMRRMQTGEATRTLIEHLGCLVICREAGRRFTVLGPRSSARSLHHALVSAAKSAL
jgi:sarcosine oxidase, subunit gamma